MSNIFERAKEEAENHPAEADSAIDKADALAKEKTSDQFDGTVDELAQKAKDGLR